MEQTNLSTVEHNDYLTKSSVIFKVKEKIKLIYRYLGPAFIISVAYIDPGNFATNISGGSLFNYHLLWVILWSNLIAIFCQTLSAKLGIATGYSLPEMCRKIFSTRTNWFFWIMATLAAMATDIAEFIGGAIGLTLLFHIPLVYAGLLIGVLTFLIVYMERYGQRVVEYIIFIFVMMIAVCYIIELFLARPDWTEVGLHTLIPMLPNNHALLIAVGMLGATVMPHAIYLHSYLVQSRNGDITYKQKAKHLRLEKLDIVLAMNMAFLVNIAIIIVSAAVFYRHGLIVQTMEEAHQTLQPLLGNLSGSIFGLSLLTSGLSSSVVGTMAGQTIMNGFVNLSISVNIRRLLTIVPAMIIVCIKVNPMQVLILSQVILSFTLPAAIIPLILITGNKSWMGSFTNKPGINFLGWMIAFVIISLNAVLLYLTFSGSI